MFDVEVLQQAARDATGLGDFGVDSYREGLERLCAALGFSRVELAVSHCVEESAKRVERAPGVVSWVRHCNPFDSAESRFLELPFGPAGQHPFYA